MGVHIRLILFPPRIRCVSFPNPRSDISAYESATVTGHYSFRSGSDEKNVVNDMVTINPIRSFYIPDSIVGLSLGRAIAFIFLVLVMQ